MNLKQSALAAAVTATLALGAAGQASAYVYGAAGLTIDNLTITIGSAGGSFVEVGRFDFTLTNTAKLNGPIAAEAAACGGTVASNDCTQTIGSMDAAPANAVGSNPIRTNNQSNGGEFEFLGTLGGNDYSNSDSWIVQAELVNLGSPTKTHNIAESLLVAQTKAKSDSEITSITGFTYTFFVGEEGPADFTLEFDADPDMYAAIFGEPPGGTYSAQANLNASITLNQDTGGTGQANWNPQGTAANDCTVGGGLACTEIADTQDLNINVGTTTNNTDAEHSWDANALNMTHYGVKVTGLTYGNWTLTLNENKSNTLNRTEAVPEPGILALMGLGLVGLFATGRRRKLS